MLCGVVFTVLRLIHALEMLNYNNRWTLIMVIVALVVFAFVSFAVTR